MSNYQDNGLPLEIIKDFVIYQIRLFTTKDAGHGGFIFYHFVVLFFGVFPASLFALLSFRREKKEDRENVHEFKNWMMTLFWTVLILFTIVKTKIVHYSSLCYFPLTFLGTYGIYKLREQKQIIPKWLKISILIVSVFWGLVIIGLQVFIQNKDRIIASGFIKDQFVVGNLQANVGWSGYEFLIGIIFITAVTLIYSTHRLKQETQIVGTLILTFLFTYSTLFFIAPRVEGYTQHAAIEFYKDKQMEDCYIETLGFKSYAQLYYFNLKKYINPKAFDEQWLLTGAIDKPVYFVMKSSDSQEYLTKYPELRIEYEENGFVFAKRDVNK